MNLPLVCAHTDNSQVEYSSGEPSLYSMVAIKSQVLISLVMELCNWGFLGTLMP